MGRPSNQYISVGVDTLQFNFHISLSYSVRYELSKKNPDELEAKRVERSRRAHISENSTLWFGWFAEEW